MWESPRLRRLRSDWKALQQLQSQSSIFEFYAQTEEPPEAYVLRFRGPGIAIRTENKVIYAHQEHEIGVRLATHYPRAMPELKWRTPIYHPNIAVSGAVCLGGYSKHWVPSLGLDELCCMLWDMLRFANYDVTSPYNKEAAQWAASQTQYAFPLDTRPLRDKVARIPPEKRVTGSHPDFPLPAPLPSSARPAPNNPAANNPAGNNPAFNNPAATKPAASSLSGVLPPAIPSPRSAGPRPATPANDDILFVDSDPPASPPRPNPSGSEEIMFLD